MRVYLAGKISINDWRVEVVSQLRTPVVTIVQWDRLSVLPMMTGDLYVGPFFIKCGHGCSEGENTHGAFPASCMAPEGLGKHIGDYLNEREDEMSAGFREQVRQKATYGITSCDLFVAYLGLDFASAYGTLAEIGFAHAWGKQIVLVVHPELDTKDFWFAMSMANFVVMSADPANAVQSLLLFRKVA